jgi:nucleotidyltransferase/DNA polymerase involved in DNA repair
MDRRLGAPISLYKSRNVSWRTTKARRLVTRLTRRPVWPHTPAPASSPQKDRNTRRARCRPIGGATALAGDMTLIIIIIMSQLVNRTEHKRRRERTRVSAIERKCRFRPFSRRRHRCRFGRSPPATLASLAGPLEIQKPKPVGEFRNCGTLVRRPLCANGTYR